MRRLAGILSVLVIAGKAMAQDTARVVPPSIDFAPNLAGTILKLVLSLAGVVGLIYLTVIVLKRLSGRSISAADPWIKVIARSHLTPKQSLVVVKLGSTYAVLGVSENSVNYIKDLSPQEVESVLTPPEKPKDFRSVLKTVLGK